MDDDEVSRNLPRVATALSKLFGDEHDFFLLVFNKDLAKDANYISSCQDDDEVRQALDELMVNFEKRVLDG